MAADFIIKTGDTAPAIQATLKDATDTAVNLTGASVRFIMRDKITGTKVVDSACSVANASTGQVEYDWQTGDTDTADTYNAEFEVHWPDLTYESFPNSKHIVVKIVQDLGGSVG